MKKTRTSGGVQESVRSIILDLLVTFMGTLAGGFVAGTIAKGDLLNSGKAGFLAGILAAIVVSIVVFAKLVSHPVAGYIQEVGTGFILYIVITLYLSVIAFPGGAIARAVRK